MPIATPPPDFDQTLMPPSRKHPTQAEAWEAGIATDMPVKTEAPVSDAKRLTDLVKLWPEPGPGALSALMHWDEDESA